MRLLETIQNNGVYVIAEMSANHAGDIENAMKIVDAAKKAGADCVKTQAYTPDSLTIDCQSDYFRIKGGLWDGYTLYELYKEACTPMEWQGQIKKKCEEEGLDFLSTPFDRSAVDYLEELNVDCYKIASFELVDIPLIEYAAGKKKPVILSCGMGSVGEIGEAVAACSRAGNNDIILLKCCSDYPADLRDMRLQTIADMRERFGLPVGLSDHSLGSLASVVAVSLGACVIEKHLTLSRDIDNPDSKFSTEPEEFEQLVRDIRAAKAAVGNACYGPTKSESGSVIFRRSLFAVRDIKKGEKFTPENVRSIRPGYGLEPKQFNAVLECTANRDIAFGEPLCSSMLCQPNPSGSQTP